MAKIVIVLLILPGLFVYLLVRGATKNVNDNIRRREDDEQARIVSEMSKRNNLIKGIEHT